MPSIHARQVPNTSTHAAVRRCRSPWPPQRRAVRGRHSCIRFCRSSGRTTRSSSSTTPRPTIRSTSWPRAGWTRSGAAQRPQRRRIRHVRARARRHARRSRPAVRPGRSVAAGQGARGAGALRTAIRRLVLVLSDAEVIDEAGQVTQPRRSWHSAAGSSPASARLLCATAISAARWRFVARCFQRVLPIPRDVPMHDMWVGSLAVLQSACRSTSTVRWRSTVAMAVMLAFANRSHWTHAALALAPAAQRAARRRRGSRARLTGPAG